MSSSSYMLDEQTENVYAPTFYLTMSASWWNFPLSTPVKIAAHQGKKPLSFPQILQICHAED